MFATLVLQLILYPTIIIGDNNLQKIEEIKDTYHYEYALSIARVESSSGSGFCTGTRVGETLFLTNNHCGTSCRSVGQFRMGYEKDMPRDEQVVFKCKSLIATNSRHDYSLFRVEENANTNAYPIATISAIPVVKDQRLMIAGHPGARTKEVDVSENCKIRNPEPSSGKPSFQHTCDTEGGSSGSSIRDYDTGWIVGLHWGTAFAPQANAGIPVTMILEDLKKQSPEILQELNVIYRFD